MKLCENDTICIVISVFYGMRASLGILLAWRYRRILSIINTSWCQAASAQTAMKKTVSDASYSSPR